MGSLFMNCRSQVFVNSFVNSKNAKLFKLYPPPRWTNLRVCSKLYLK